MTGAIQQLVSSFNYWVPPGINRQIFFSSVILTLSSYKALSLRDQKSLYELKDRINNEGDRFVEWLTKPYDSSQISILKKDPKQLLHKAYLSNLSCKVGVAAACYLTIDASIYTSLIKLASQSDKISKIALPILEKIGSVPIPTFVNYARFIALIPALLEIVHYMLVYRHLITDNLSSLTKALEKDIGTLSNRMEILWNLRFTVVCLAASQTLFYSVIQALTFFSLQNFLSAEFGNVMTQAIRGLQFSGLAPWPFDKMADFIPTLGFSTGLSSTYRTLLDSHEPYNIQKLEEIFNAAHDVNGNLENLKAYHDEILRLHDEIKGAWSKGTINQAHVQSLSTILHERCQTILETFLQNHALEGVLTQKESCSQFQTIYGPKGLVRTGACNWETFKEQLVNINKLNWAMDNLPELNQALKGITAALQKEIKSRNLSPQQLQFFQKYLSKKMKSFYEANVQSHSADDADFWRQNEAELRKLFGVEGFFSEVDQSGEAFLLQHRFHFTLFNLNLNWYLTNQHSLDKDHQKVCEHLIYRQVERDGIFNLSWEQMVKIPAFEKFLQEREIEPTQQQNTAIRDLLIKDFLNSTNIFDHVQQGIVISPDFKFATVLLVRRSAIMRLLAAKSKNLIDKKHLPDNANPLFDHQFQFTSAVRAEGSKLLNKEVEELGLANHFFNRKHKEKIDIHYADFEKIQELDLSPLEDNRHLSAMSQLQLQTRKLKFLDNQLRSRTQLKKPF